MPCADTGCGEAGAQEQAGQDHADEAEEVLSVVKVRRVMTAGKRHMFGIAKVGPRPMGVAKGPRSRCLGPRA